MKNPFQFSTPVMGTRFTGRTWLLDQLESIVSNGRNAFIFAPVGWGKKSLTGQLIHLHLPDHSFRVLNINLHPGATEDDLYQSIRCGFNNLAGLKFYYPPLETMDGRDILGMTGTLASSNRIRLLVIIHGLSHASNLFSGSSLLRRISRTLPFQEKTSYLFLEDCNIAGRYFRNRLAQDALKTGMVFCLPTLDCEDLKTFLVQRFADTGKKISNENARRLAHSCSCIPYFTQLLAWQCWGNTGRVVSRKTVRYCESTLGAHYRQTFQHMYSRLTGIQARLLLSLAETPHEPYSAERISRYRLHSSGALSRAYTGLMNKGILTWGTGIPVFCNPFFPKWLIRNRKEVRITWPG